MLCSLLQSLNDNYSQDVLLRHINISAFSTKHLIEIHYNCHKIRHYIKQHSHIHLLLDCGEETNPEPIT